MTINPKPPGLLSRRMFEIDRGWIVVEERWNIDEPGCPLIQSPWHSPLQGGPIVIRQLEMTKQDFNDSDILLFN